MKTENPESNTCLNCGSELSGSYCSNCGQSADVSRISFRDTLADFFSAAFALEGPFIQTTKLLFINPGKVFREFLNGKRKRYYKPVGYFILLVAIYLLIRSILDYDPVDDRFKRVEENPELDLSLIKEAAKLLFQNINKFLFLLVLGIAFSFKLFFARSYRLAEYVAIGFYITAVYILFGIPTMLIYHFTPFKSDSLHLWFLVVYIIICSISLFQRPSFSVISRSVLVGLFSFALYMILAFGISFIIVWLK